MPKIITGRRPILSDRFPTNGMRMTATTLLQGFAVGGEIAGASAMILEHSPFGRRGYFGSFTLQGVQAGQIIAAAVFLPLSAIMSKEAFESWGWRIPFLLSALVVVAGYVIRRRVDETPAFQEEAEHGEVPAAPIVMAVRENGSDMLRLICMALMNAIPTTVTVFGLTYATSAGYGVGLTTTNYLWISVSGNIVAVILIPFVGNLTDKIGRRPVMIVGCLGSGILAFPYLYFVSQGNLMMAFLFAILMWGVVYQGYNAVFPSFYQELFPTKTRVSAFAVSQNIGTLITHSCRPSTRRSSARPPAPVSSTRSSLRTSSSTDRPAVRWRIRSNPASSGRSAASPSGWPSSRPSRPSPPARPSASTSTTSATRTPCRFPARSTSGSGAPGWTCRFERELKVPETLCQGRPVDLRRPDVPCLVVSCRVPSVSRPPCASTSPPSARKENHDLDHRPQRPEPEPARQPQTRGVRLHDAGRRRGAVQ